MGLSLEIKKKSKTWEKEEIKLQDRNLGKKTIGSKDPSRGECQSSWQFILFYIVNHHHFSKGKTLVVSSSLTRHSPLQSFFFFRQRFEFLL